MSDVSVIGIGSPFGNDTIGWQVIHTLRRQHTPSAVQPDQLELIETDRPGINLIQMLQGKRFVILIDALLNAQRHGEVICLDKAQIIESQKYLSSHSLDVASAITLGDKLGVLPKKLSIMGIAIDPKLNDPIPDSAIHALAELVNHSIKEYFAKQTTR